VGYQNPPCTAPFLIRENDKPLAIKCRLRQEHSSNPSFYKFFFFDNTIYSLLFSLKKFIHNPATYCHKMAKVFAFPKTSRHNVLNVRHLMTNVCQRTKMFSPIMASSIHKMAKSYRLMANSGGSLKKCFQTLLNSRKCLSNLRQIRIAVIYLTTGTLHYITNNINSRLLG